MAEKTEAQKKAQKNYMSKFSRLQIRVDREKQEAIQVHAASHGESVNAFVNRAIDETMERDNLPDVPEGKPRRLKDGSFKWGKLRFSNEQELETYVKEIMEKIPIRN